MLAVVALCARVARADPWTIPVAPDEHVIGGFRARGKTKVSETTVGYLAHLHVGQPVRPADIPQIEEALLSSELFESVKVTLEDGPDGVLVVATVEDKLSWIAAPTLYLLPNNRAFGVGYAENDLGGRDQKFLLYGQLGTQTSLFFGAFLDPAVHGSKLYYRIDAYLERRYLDEYLNPADDPTSQAIARSSRELFVDAGALVGWQFEWWFGADLRLRAADVTFRDVHDAAGNAAKPPEKDGKDTTVQLHVTLDHRVHRFGVTWGPYAQLELEESIPGFDDFNYFFYLLRAYYSWRIFGDHQLELRTIFNGGYNLPFHEEVALGGVGDLRGYPTDQFRGDFNAVLRAEYSVPITRWKIFAFRALGFYDTGYDTFLSRRADRDYLPTQLGRSFARNDIGGGLRVYVKNVVLPLLGLDFGYGIEGKNWETYFEVGLTDF